MTIRMLWPVAWLLSACATEPAPKPAPGDDTLQPPPADTGAPSGCCPGDPGTDPEALLVPSTALIDLGTVDPRCGAEQVVTLENQGDATATGLTVTPSAGFTAELSTDVLGPGDHATLTTTWTGDDPEASTGTVTVDASGLAAPITIDLLLDPGLPSTTLVAEAGDRTTADVLLAVDRSCNVDDMDRIAPSWPTLRDALDGHGIDLRIASVVAADGCIHGDPIVVEPGVDDETMLAMLWAQQDWWSELDATTERLLEKSVLALDLSSDDGCNAGLHDPSRPVHIVAFSDEPDQSPGTWTDYLPGWAAHTDAGVPYAVHGIGEDADNTCPTASPYWGALEAAEHTGGAWLRWCAEDFDAQMTHLADTMAGIHRRLELPELDGFDPTVSEDTLHTVEVDDVPVEGWSYDATRQAVLLPAVPPPGSTIRVSFTPSPECSEE